MERTYTLSELPEIANALLANTTTKRFLFFGEMGVGKTTLIKEMIKVLGVKDNIGSPTYAIVNEYRTDDEIINHFDFYRIESIDEVFDIGIEEYFESDHWLFIEWPEKIESILPKEFLKIKMNKLDNEMRTLKALPVK